MNTGIKDRWVAALRSGEYKQGSGALRDIKDNFCCLGVLADLYSKEKGVSWEVPEGGQHHYAIHRQGGILPIEVAEWADIRDKNGTIDICPCAPSETFHGYDCLTGLNDAGVPFPKIADIIEKHL